MAAMAFKTSTMDLTARFDLFRGQHVGCFAQLQEDWRHYHRSFNASQDDYFLRDRRGNFLPWDPWVPPKDDFDQHIYNVGIFKLQLSTI